MCWLSGQLLLVSAFTPKLRGDEQKRHEGFERSEASGPWTTKPFPTDAWVVGALVQRKFTSLIRGDLSGVPVSRACPKGGATGVTRLVP